MSIYNDKLGELHTSVSAEEIIAAAKSEVPKKRISRAAAIPIVIAAAMSILVVSVGAACSWDLGSLLISEYSGYRRDKAMWDVYTAGTEQEQFMYGTYTAPEGLQEYHQMTDKELELLDRLTVNVGETLEFDDFDFCLTGLIYDGYILRAFATITDNINSEIDPHNDDMSFTLMIDDHTGDLDVVGMGAGHSGDYRGKNHVDWTYEWGVQTFPENTGSVTFIVHKRGETVNGYTDYYECGRITVKLPDTGGLSRTYRLGSYTDLGDYGYSHLKEARFSPLGAYIDYDFNFDGRFKDLQSFHIGHPPVFVTMNDGTVIELQGGVGNRAVNANGSFSHGWLLSQKGYMIDVSDIAAVQIGDDITELDESMIIEQ